MNAKKIAKPTKATAKLESAKPDSAKAEDAPQTKTTRAKPARDAKPKNATSTQVDSPPAPQPKKLSALDAAARVLAEAGEPLGAKQMIEAMTAKGYWTSPGGKTPHATLYSAILREIGVKGKDARFKKTDRGRFAANG